MTSHSLPGKHSPTPQPIFCRLGGPYSHPAVAAILQHYGLPQALTPLSREQKQLLVLGVADAVSPGQIAAAYRKLFLELKEFR